MPGTKLQAWTYCERAWSYFNSNPAFATSNTPRVDRGRRTFSNILRFDVRVKAGGYDRFRAAQRTCGTTDMRGASGHCAIWRIAYC